MSAHDKRQWVMGFIAVAGLIAAGFIAYQRGLFTGGDDPLNPPGDPTLAAADVNVYNPRTVVKPFPAIVDAPTLKADEVTDEVTAEELVLGVEVNGEARAYPINQLCGPDREIINDTLGNRAIAATW